MKEIWVFDENHRVYERDENGKVRGDSIYREKWKKAEVIGETKQSWLLKYPQWIMGKSVNKVPKNKPVHWAKFSLKDVENDCWAQENKFKISSAVSGLDDCEKLKRISDILKEI